MFHFVFLAAQLTVSKKMLQDTTGEKADFQEKSSKFERDYAVLKKEHENLGDSLKEMTEKLEHLQSEMVLFGLMSDFCVLL